MTPRSIGLLGGSFDPPHAAHLELARQALAQLDLDEVWFIPARRAPHKHRDLTDAPHRLAMLQLALDDTPGLAICTIELDDPDLVYSVDTIEALRHAHRGASFWLLLGADQLQALPRWRDTARLLGMVSLAVLARPGSSVDAAANLPASNVVWLEGQECEVSSSEIRSAVARGERPEALRHAVAEYISAHRLYAGEPA